jgi:DNA-binding transcriptional LysR family regulator
VTEHDRPEVDLLALRSFRAVAEGGSFAAAQAALGVSQSTISERLARLESTIGASLCERGRGGFRLTEEGRELMVASDRLFGELLAE